MSPQGTRFTQAEAVRLSRAAHVVLLCGRYEGVDERVRARVAEEISIGDYVLSGGELPALVVDRRGGAAACRESWATISRWWTIRSAAGCSIFRTTRGRRKSESLRVPDVLLSGNHAEIRRWRKRESLSRTLERRPDLLADAALDEEEREILRELVAERKT